MIRNPTKFIRVFIMIEGELNSESSFTQRYGCIYERKDTVGCYVCIQKRKSFHRNQAFWAGFVDVPKRYSKSSFYEFIL